MNTNFQNKLHSVCAMKVVSTKGLRYIITSDGRLYSFKSKRFLSQHDNGRGYITVGVCNKKHYIHRLVAKAFLPKPTEDKIQVNHIDECKQHNALHNLEWSTPLDNTNHSIKALRKAAKKRREHESWIGQSNSTRTVIALGTKQTKSRNYSVIVRCECSNEFEMYYNDFLKDKSSYCSQCRPKSSYLKKSK